MPSVFGLGNFGKRLLEGVVSLFAILGFVYVPLGRHTGFEHARAVFSTPAAASAIEDLTTTALGLRQRAVDFFTGRGSPAAITDGDDLGAKASPKRPGREPRPVPPKLK